MFGIGRIRKTGKPTKTGKTVTSKWSKVLNKTVAKPSFCRICGLKVRMSGKTSIFRKMETRGVLLLTLQVTLVAQLKGKCNSFTIRKW